MIDQLAPNVLIIGATTDGIGAAVVDAFRSGDQWVTVHTPSPVELDVTDNVSIERWFNEYPHERIDCTLYAAGAKHLQWIQDINIQRVKNTFDVNVYGYLRILRQLTDKQDSGRVCAITSDAAITPMSTSVDYCASKAALEMSIKIAARELGINWHITGIRPSVVDETDMTRNDVTDISGLRGWSRGMARHRMVESNPVKRMVTKADVADIAMWLLMKAPDMMTGSIVEVRGGK